MILTAEKYQQITGEAAPSGFAQLEALAEERVHARTLYAYVGRNLSDIPSIITDRLYMAIAYETRAIDLAGGMDAMAGLDAQSMSLGSFSYSGGGGKDGQGANARLCDGAEVLIPMLIGYGRGMNA